MFEVDTQKLAEVTTLAKGSHGPTDTPMCIMEAVAYVTGLLKSDHPICTCPVITSFLIAWNDDLPTSERDRLLLPLIPKLVNTVGSSALEARRATMAADWYIRIYTLAWLDLIGLVNWNVALKLFQKTIDPNKTSAILAALKLFQQSVTEALDFESKLVDETTIDALLKTTSKIADGAASRAATRVGLSGVSKSVLYKAESVASSAIELAALNDISLEETKHRLQLSAVELVERMCALKEDDNG